MRHGRDAARYVRDMFDHFGTRTVKKPWGELTRYRLFDLPWDAGRRRRRRAPRSCSARRRARRPGGAPGGDLPLPRELRARGAGQPAHPDARAQRLGQEHHRRLHPPRARALLDARRGRALPLPLGLPEPEDSSRAPSASGAKARRRAPPTGASYAHLDDDQIDARLVIELRDHPLFLLPIPERQALLLRLYAAAGVKDAPPDWLLSGKLSHKNQQVFEALFTSYKGSLAEVLRHVQVERWFISRRYRAGAVTLGPALSVDAGERQITADRSLVGAAHVPPGDDAVRGARRARSRPRAGCSSSAICSSARSTRSATSSSRSRRARSRSSSRRCRPTW